MVCQLTSDRRQAKLGQVIRSFRHRGLRALYNGRTARYVAADHLTRLRDILAVLDRSHQPSDTSLPGFRLHPLRGAQRGYWAVSVSGNWRVTFRFEEGDAYDVDYIDYS